MDEKTRNWYLSRGIVLLGDPIGKSEAIEVLARLEFLTTHRPGQEIKLLINSPGGMAHYSLVIYDEIKKLSVPVATGCAGMADGAAAILLMAGTNGRRSALSHSVIHVAGVWRAAEGLDTPEQMEEVEKVRSRLVEIMTTCTGQPEEVALEWMNSQKEFSAQEALHAGIIDFVVPQEKGLGGEDGIILGLFRPCED